MTERRMVSIDDISVEDLERIIQRACDLYEDISHHDAPLRGLICGLAFLQTSTRTRTAFSVASLRLGANIVTYGPSDLQLNTGESVDDSGRVLSSMLDLLVVRSRGDNSEMVRWSADGTLPVVNAMSATEHPTQALADLSTLKHTFGTLSGISVLYIGEGNNTAVALAKALALVGDCDATFWTPPGFGLPKFVTQRLQDSAATGDANIREIHVADELPESVDVVYTTRWQTTGTTKAKHDWREDFREFYVDESLMKRWPEALFMHDLPAHRGEEVASSVIDGGRSIIWKQSHMKMTSAMGVLEWLEIS